MAEVIRATVVPRRNARGGRGSAEHLIAGLRCLYRRAAADGLSPETCNPALKAAKPGRLPSARRAVADVRLAEINEVVASTEGDPVLESLLQRLHSETGCSRGQRWHCGRRTWTTSSV
ncbi:hypothetical protein OHA21_01000 [Actinoplanes sp. NBC_00393]|uniref:hypothetical protein n=1 Tax=Actinoplanes sp. NBC_00393 TaxID=2975953 RepID=UPI002E1E14D6